MCLKVLSQSYMITYEQFGFNPNEKRAMPFTFNIDSIYDYPEKIVIKLLFNDSIGFSAICDKNKTAIDMYEKVGKKRIQSHTSFTISRNNIFYNVRYWPQHVKKDFFVLDTLSQKKWQHDSSNGYSLFNYSCSVAYSVSAEGDTTFVYYTKELPGKFGPLYLKGAPGIILGTFEQWGSRSFIATNIEKINYEMKLPGDKIVLTRKEYENRKNE